MFWVLGVGDINPEAGRTQLLMIAYAAGWAWCVAFEHPAPRVSFRYQVCRAALYRRGAGADSRLLVAAQRSSPFTGRSPISAINARLPCVFRFSRKSRQTPRKNGAFSLKVATSSIAYGLQAMEAAGHRKVSVHGSLDPQ